MFSELRSIQSSVEHRIFTILRQQNWTVQRTNWPLNRQGDSTVTYGRPESYPFCHLDADGNTSLNGFTVKVGGVTIDPSQYTIDFRNTSVTFNNPVAGAVTVTALQYAVNVTEGYPEEEYLETHELPVVAYEMESSEGRDFDIGSSMKFRERYFTIDILGKNKGDRIDLTNDLERYIVKVYLYNMTEHQPLTSEGAINPSFTDTLLIGQMRFSDGPRSTLVPPAEGGSDKERYRGLVAFTLERIS
jgi:hypothetical protein